MNKKYLDITELNALANKVNLRLLCDSAGLNYYTIAGKLHRFRYKERYGFLTYKQSQKLTEALNLLSNEIKYDLPLPKYRLGDL